MGTGSGLTGTYYTDTSFSHEALTRTDPTVNFNWSAGVPDPAIPPDYFSVRWTGQLQAQYNETYTLQTVSDDGIRVTVNGQTLINDWTPHAAKTDTATMALVAGQSYAIELDYYQNAGGAQAKLSWSSASTPLTVIPTSQLFTAAPTPVTLPSPWVDTNNSTVVNWSDRAHTTDATQATAKGAAWEYAIQLANTAQKDLWINIPAGATTDYVTQLATLLKSSLNADRIIYVEYSNETWNSQFTQYTTAVNAANAQIASGDHTLNYDGTTSAYLLAGRYTAARLKQISDIFAGVFGAGAINTRVRPVLASQVANSPLPT